MIHVTPTFKIYLKVEFAFVQWPDFTECFQPAANSVRQRVCVEVWKDFSLDLWKAAETSKNSNLNMCSGISFFPSFFIYLLFLRPPSKILHVFFFSFSARLHLLLTCRRCALPTHWRLKKKNSRREMHLVETEKCWPRNTDEEKKWWRVLRACGLAHVAAWKSTKASQGSRGCNRRSWVENSQWVSRLSLFRVGLLLEFIFCGCKTVPTLSWLQPNCAVGDATSLTRTFSGVSRNCEKPLC